MKRGAGRRFVVALISLLSVPPAFADDILKALDTDGDGTVDIEEAETAGSKVFHALDRDKDGTLDAQELSGRLEVADLQDRDSDNDGTLDHNEYAKLVAIKFKALDVDDDGKLDAQELNSPAAAALLKLIQ